MLQDSIWKLKLKLKKLDEQLTIWREGKIGDLLREGIKIQKKLKASNSRSSEDTAKIFAKLMLQGKINAAVKFLSSENDQGGVLRLSNDVLEDLELKHPDPALVREDSLMYGPIQSVLPSYFDCIDEELIKNAVRQTKGAGGPSHLDADQYRHMLLSQNYKKEGKDLRDQIAILARKLAKQIIDPISIKSLIACRLIPLNKNPGVRPRTPNRNR